MHNRNGAWAVPGSGSYSLENAYNRGNTTNSVGPTNRPSVLLNHRESMSRVSWAFSQLSPWQNPFRHDGV